MPESLVVRFGQMRFLGEFTGLADQVHPRGQKVVVATDRGLELGEVLRPVPSCGTPCLENPCRGAIVRVADAEDLNAATRLDEVKQRGMTVCRELIARRKLDMNLVDVEVVLGGERIVFYYLADQRVDFRELVKDLARCFRTRIEMRQIGVRDEAKLLADYGDCGQPVCCRSHLSRMPPVSMRMAKLQKTTLDPAKISGRCGRLKCCLRYEFDTYQELERTLPPIGSRVQTARGAGKVLALEVLACKAVVEFEDRRKVLIEPSEVLSITKKGKAPRDDVDHGKN